ncbi:hypothetical protein Tamer19_63730 [Cupriavidus sp. TA19]|uniref:hypothetical protein n=1 Tax=unclassified Cupriavidus TaxID=2640874 RepID=UPI000EBC481C|nr:MULTISPECIES: hypothetical protein [unclassified Cupriavidus]BDB27225.1 hypothetical protein CTP10_R46300 [Cupriavidus sp. P-10]GLC96964.1 hypothetical protein Tamer19_63730 [Cupriavidus sp. TA19]
MATRLIGLAVTAMAWTALTMGASIARADEIPLITGKQWTESSDQMKKAYLVGIANVVQVDVAYHAGNSPPDSASIVPRFARGLKAHSLDSVRQGLDRWYAAHPDQLQRPVIETIWFEMVVPGLAGKK